MKWSSAVSENPDLDGAIDEAVEAVRSQLEGLEPHLVVVFVAVSHAEGFDRLLAPVRSEFPEATVVGCSGAGVLGGGHEVEYRAGTALTAAHLPDVTIADFHISNDELPDPDTGPEHWEDLVGVRASSEPHFVLLADPFSFDPERLAMGLDFAFPDSTKVGGIASGGMSPAEHALFLNDTVYRSGLVGIALSGAITVDSVVAQGCRPIGVPMQVTSISKNMLVALDDKKPLRALQEVFDTLSEGDQRLAQQALFIGVAMDPLNDNPELGDFLVRNIVGANEETGAIAVSANLREGQTVQFHIRDAQTSPDDLDQMLSKYAGGNPLYEETGALLFSCLGRGENLYGRPNHDSEMFREKVSAMPLSGFFCNGEIGPVGGSTFLHSYTSSFGIFRPKL